MKLVDKSYKDIIDKDKKIVCFGAGKAFRNFVDAFEGKGILNYIDAVVDNNKDLNDTYVEIHNHKIRVISMETFVTDEKYLHYEYIITTTYFREIIAQVNNYKIFNDKECYYYGLILSNSDNSYYTENLPDTLRITDTPIIPKIIHYCWFGRGEKTRLNLSCIESWKTHCPDYDIIEWSEDNYDISKNEFMRKAYENKQWAFVADVARPDIIYNHGGIYLDTDVTVVRNLDDLLYQKAFMGIEISKKINLGSGFGAIKKMPVFLDLYKAYDAIKFSFEGIINKQLVSPYFTKKYFNNLGYINNGKYQRIGDITIYPEKVLSGFNPRTGKQQITEDTFMMHLHEGSWAQEEDTQRIKKDWDVLNSIKRRA
ncbi:glycosyltransferase family 32 protein [Desulfobacter curvatus]|uniref:glycosyltransferase family 32 protein n=1 Tax=Desulfobacter curvatus TaxID=2290 RepID=UPI0003754631|nr:glycosyltransferase [Desulfobacter curvatus]